MLALAPSSVMAATAPTAALPVQAGTYTDNLPSYAQQAILALTNEGYIHGFPNQLYEPTAAITRGQFLAYLMDLIEPTTHVFPAAAQTQHFSDVAPGNWDFTYVGAAFTAGWIQGSWVAAWPGKPFNENYVASRGDAASFFVAALEHAGTLTLPKGMSPLAFAYQAGWFTGLPATESKIYMDRADAAVVLQNMAHWLQTKAAPARPAQPLIAGWNYGSDTATYLLQDEHDTPVNTFIYDGFHFSDGDTFSNTLSSAFATTLETQGKQVWGLFGNDNDVPDTTQALATPTSRLAMAQQIEQICAADHLDGANIDFENVPATDREGLSLFAQTLSSVLHQVGMTASFDVSPPSTGSFSAAYDYAQLGYYADNVIVMTYDEHWSTDPTPGPVTSLPWVQSNLQQLLQMVPAQKLVLGMPLYTRSWEVADPGAGSYAIPLTDMAGIIAAGVKTSSIDASVGQLVDQYTGPGGEQYEFWQDSAQPLKTIADLAVTDHLAGVAYWRLGFEAVGSWPSLLPYSSTS